MNSLPSPKVRQDSEGNDIRVGDLVKVIEQPSTAFQVVPFLKITRLMRLGLGAETLPGAEHNTYLIGYKYVVKAKNSPELTAYILAHCGG